MKNKKIVYIAILVSLATSALLVYNEFFKKTIWTEDYDTKTLRQAICKSSSVALYEYGSNQPVFETHVSSELQSLIDKLVVDPDCEQLVSSTYSPNYDLVFSHDSKVCARLFLYKGQKFYWRGVWRFQFELTPDSMREFVEWFCERGVEIQLERGQSYNFQGKGSVP